MAAKSIYTDPDQVEDFVHRTEVDSLAISIGTSHGAYKFKPSQCSRNQQGVLVPPPLRFDILEEIENRIPGFAIVLHGSSSVLPEYVDTINQYGGKMPDTFGIAVEQIQDGIKHGVRKVNVDTDSRLAMTGAIRKALAESPEKFDPRDYLKPARQAAYDVYKARMEAFGQAGHAGDYKPVTLDDMKAVYGA